MSKNKMIITIILVSSLFFIPFQNCSQVDFESIQGSQNNSSSLEHSERTKVFNISQQYLATESIHNIYLIIDNSKSMQDNKNKMMTGLMNMLSNLKGYSVKIRVYSTESLVDKNDLKTVLTHDQDSNHIYSLNNEGVYTFEDGKSETKPFNSYKQYKSYTAKFHLDKDYSEKMNLDLSLNKKDSSDESLNILKNNLIKVINSIPEAKSGVESGLCTLAKILSEDGQNRVLEKGDKASFVIITDENDTVATEGPFACAELIKVDINNENSNQHVIECKGSQCPFKLYQMSFYYYQYNVVATARVGDRSYEVNLGASEIVFDPNTYGDTGRYDCTMNELEDALDNLSVKSGAEISQHKDLYCYRRVYRGPFTLQLIVKPDQVGYNANLCDNQDSFYAGKLGTNNTVLYNNMNDYLISYTGLKNPSFSCIQKWGQFVTASSDVSNYKLKPHFFMKAGTKLESYRTDLFVYSLAEQLNSVLGEGKYQFIPIVHSATKDNLHGCQLKSETGSYGKLYEDFLKIAKAKGSVQSICQNSYSLSFNSITEYIKKEGNKSIVIEDMKAGEAIIELKIIRQSQEIYLAPGEFQVFGKRIEFTEGALKDGDQLEVKIMR